MVRVLVNGLTSRGKVSDAIVDKISNGDDEVPTLLFNVKEHQFADTLTDLPRNTK